MNLRIKTNTNKKQNNQHTLVNTTIQKKPAQQRTSHKRQALQKPNPRLAILAAADPQQMKRHNKPTPTMAIYRHPPSATKEGN
jgi:hypothetical protein